MKVRLRQIAEFLFRLALLGGQLALFLIVLYRVIPVPVTPLMLMRGIPYEKDWVSFEHISPHMVKAAITAEDPKFANHYGFDLEAIRESVEKAVDKGKKPKGRSTISQQTAKNLFFGTARSWVRKGLEVPVTLCLEMLWNKRRIIEVYLNIIEMGEDIYGIEAAAQTYFRKPATKLSPAESALIAVCFPNPLKRSPVKPSSYVLKMQRTILRWMGGYEPAPDWWWEDHKPDKSKRKKSGKSKK